MKVRVPTRIDVSNGGELLIRAQLQPKEILLDTAGKVACSVLRKVSSRCSRVDERRSDSAGLHNGDGASARAAGAIRSAAEREVRLHDGERRQNRIGIDLIDVVCAQQAQPAFTDVTDFCDQSAGELALNRKIPLMHALELQILIEHRQARSVGLHLNGRGELGGRLCRGCGQSIGETLIDANVGHR